MAEYKYEKDDAFFATSRITAIEAIHSGVVCLIAHSQSAGTAESIACGLSFVCQTRARHGRSGTKRGERFLKSRRRASREMSRANVKIIPALPLFTRFSFIRDRRSVSRRRNFSYGKWQAANN